MVVPAHEYIIIKNEADEVVYALNDQQITIIRYHWVATSVVLHWPVHSRYRYQVFSCEQGWQSSGMEAITLSLHIIIMNHFNKHSTAFSCSLFYTYSTNCVTNDVHSTCYRLCCTGYNTKSNQLIQSLQLFLL